MINEVLLLYHHFLRREAPTISEHINAFLSLSRFKIHGVNVELGFYPGLRDLRFKAIVLHYSLFGDYPFRLGERYLNYLEDCRHSYKVALFQDEYQFCPQRFALIGRLNIDCIYSLLEPPHAQQVYGKQTTAKELRYTLTGYVSDELVALARRTLKPDKLRSIDVGYRARRLPYRMGKGGQEKAAIAEEFGRRAWGLGFVLDIKPGAHRRLNGLDWYHYMADCRGFLGVEAGVSVFDLDDTVRLRCEQLLSENPSLSFDEISARVLAPLENNIPYRTISPRHFEAAAFRVCQILFEGRYSGILQPMRHYLPLKKDFSNFEEVIRLFGDPNVRAEITDQAYRDLIASGEFSYRRFVAGFDRDLGSAGLTGHVSGTPLVGVEQQLKKGHVMRFLRAVWLRSLFLPFPGRNELLRVYRARIRPFILRLRGKKGPVHANQQPS